MSHCSNTVVKIWLVYFIIKFSTLSSLMSEIVFQESHITCFYIEYGKVNFLYTANYNHMPIWLCSLWRYTYSRSLTTSPLKSYLPIFPFIWIPHLLLSLEIFRSPYLYCIIRSAFFRVWICRWAAWHYRWSTLMFQTCIHFCKTYWSIAKRVLIWIANTRLQL